MNKTIILIFTFFYLLALSSCVSKTEENLDFIGCVDNYEFFCKNKILLTNDTISNFTFNKEAKNNCFVSPNFFITIFIQDIKYYEDTNQLREDLRHSINKGELKVYDDEQIKDKTYSVRYLELENSLTWLSVSDNYKSFYLVAQPRFDKHKKTFQYEDFKNEFGTLLNTLKVGGDCK